MLEDPCLVPTFGLLSAQVVNTFYVSLINTTERTLHSALLFLGGGGREIPDGLTCGSISLMTTNVSVVRQ